MKEMLKMNKKEQDYYYVLNQLGHEIQNDYVKLFPVTNRTGNCLKQFSDVIEELKKKWSEEIFKEIKGRGYKMNIQALKDVITKAIKPEFQKVEKALKNQASYMNELDDRLTKLENQK